MSGKAKTPNRRKKALVAPDNRVARMGGGICLQPGPHYRRPQNFFQLEWIAKQLESTRGEPNDRGEVDLAAGDLRILGQALRRIAGGEDARHIFGQRATRGAQDDRVRNQTVAFVYLHQLASGLAAGASERQAVRSAAERAQRKFPDKKLDAATVRRYATKYRDGILTTLRHMEHAGIGPALDALKQHLEKHGEHIGDGPDLPPLGYGRATNTGRK